MHLIIVKLQYYIYKTLSNPLGCLFLLLIFSQCTSADAFKKTTTVPLVIAYYSGDGTSIQQFDLNGVDHLIYSFLHLKGNQLAIDNAKDSISLMQLTGLKTKYPELKVLVSLRGWGGCETCSDVFNTEEGRIEFAQSTAAIIEHYNADGIDLDWEYPAISGILTEKPINTILVPWFKNYEK